jgi:hypothetical protein
MSRRKKKQVLRVLSQRRVHCEKFPDEWEVDVSRLNMSDGSCRYRSLFMLMRPVVYQGRTTAYGGNRFYDTLADALGDVRPGYERSRRYVEHLEHFGSPPTGPEFTLLNNDLELLDLSIPVELVDR